MKTPASSSTDLFDLMFPAVREDFKQALEQWRELDLPTGPAIVDDHNRARTLVELAVGVAGVSLSTMEGLEHALDTADGQIPALLAALQAPAERLAERRLTICKDLLVDRQFVEVHDEARRLAVAAYAAGRVDLFAQSLLLAGRGHRGLDQNVDATRAYEAMIDVCREAKLTELLCAAYDNYGNALLSLQRYDDAAAAYGNSAALACTPMERFQIAQNRANLLCRIGELSQAHAVYEGIVHDLEHDASDEAIALSARALDNDAMLHRDEGSFAKAAALAEQARTLLSDCGVDDRIVNLLNLSEIYVAVGDRARASSMFTEAHSLAFAEAEHTIDETHYRQGFNAALASQSPAGSEPQAAFGQALIAAQLGNLPLAGALLQASAATANEIGDVALSLRARSNLADVERRLGDIDAAGALQDEVRAEAAGQGLARPEAVALINLASMVEGGYRSPLRLGALGALARASVLTRLHAQLVEEAGLVDGQRDWELHDDGTCGMQLAWLAGSFGADALAAEYLRTAIPMVRGLEQWEKVANRTAELRLACERLGDEVGVQAAVDDLQHLLERSDLSHKGQAVAHRSIAGHLVEAGDLVTAIDHLRQTQLALSDLAETLPPGVGRVSAVSDFEGNARWLSCLLHQEGRDDEAFAELQRDKGRRIFEAAAQRADRGFEPLTAAQAEEALNDLNTVVGEPSSVLVDFAVVDANNVTAYVVTSDRLLTVDAAVAIAELDHLSAGDIGQREAAIVDACLHRDDLRTLVERIERELTPGASVFLVPDGPLVNLPLHIVPVDNTPWCDLHPIGYLPGATAITWMTRSHTRTGEVLVAGNSRDDLPGAAAECESIGEILHTLPLVGSEQCTRDTVLTRLVGGRFDVVHLAVHGRGDVHEGDRGALCLATADGSPEWVPFDDLARQNWDAELVVFSGCSTAIAGPKNGRELVGVARSALESGAPSVIACLWPVGDLAARTLMTAFYRELVKRQEAGLVDLRLVLSHAQQVLRDECEGALAATGRRRDGRREMPPAVVGDDAPPPVDVASDVHQALSWAPFILLGDCIFGGVPAATAS